MIVLGVMNLDLALRIEQPVDLTEKSSFDNKRDMEKWDYSNGMSLMIMNRAIPEALRGTMSKQVTTAKGSLRKLRKRFVKNKKTETSTLLANLISMKYKGMET